MNAVASIEWIDKILEVSQPGCEVHTGRYVYTTPKNSQHSKPVWYFHIYTPSRQSYIPGSGDTLLEAIHDCAVNSKKGFIKKGGGNVQVVKETKKKAK